jgi:hypothetical protein
VPPIGAIIRRNIKPLLAYLEYLKLENSIKDKLIESFAGDLEDLKYALFNCGYNDDSILKSYKILKKEGFRLSGILDNNYLFVK